jgi:hypothetical protein
MLVADDTQHSGREDGSEAVLILQSARGRTIQRRGRERSLGPDDLRHSKPIPATCPSEEAYGSVFGGPGRRVGVL